MSENENHEAEIRRLDGIVAEQRARIERLERDATERDLLARANEELVKALGSEITAISRMFNSGIPLRTQRPWVDRITALLALPANTDGDDIAKAVEICVRHCEKLELERAEQPRPKTIDEAIGWLRDAFPRITDEDRLKIFERIEEDYCQYCGCLKPVFGCPCTNDE